MELLREIGEVLEELLVKEHVVGEEGLDEREWLMFGVISFHGIKIIRLFWFNDIL